MTLSDLYERHYPMHFDFINEVLHGIDTFPFKNGELQGIENSTFSTSAKIFLDTSQVCGILNIVLHLNKFAFTPR